jgi:hypothetical protein
VDDGNKTSASVRQKPLLPDGCAVLEIHSFYESVGDTGPAKTATLYTVQTINVTIGVKVFFHEEGNNRFDTESQVYGLMQAFSCEYLLQRLGTTNTPSGEPAILLEPVECDASQLGLLMIDVVQFVSIAQGLFKALQAMHENAPRIAHGHICAQTILKVLPSGPMNQEMWKLGHFDCCVIHAATPELLIEDVRDLGRFLYKILLGWEAPGTIEQMETELTTRGFDQFLGLFSAALFQDQPQAISIYYDLVNLSGIQLAQKVETLFQFLFAFFPQGKAEREETRF